jgi:hypothetical protein
VSTSNKVDDQFLPGAGHPGGHHGNDAVRPLVRPTLPVVLVLGPRVVLEVLEGLLVLPALRIEFFDDSESRSFRNWAWLPPTCVSTEMIVSRSVPAMAHS